MSDVTEPAAAPKAELDLSKFPDPAEGPKVGVQDVLADLQGQVGALTTELSKANRAGDYWRQQYEQLRAAVS